VSAFTIIKPGLLTTVQDLGRRGWQGAGVPVAGPMDAYSHRLANRLLGNPDDASALEITLLGPELRAGATAACAVAGARFALTVDGSPVEMDRTFVVKAGQVLRFGAREAGSRATLAVAGGFLLPQVFGSQATSLISRMGPFPGPLKAGDQLPFDPHASRDSAARGTPLPLPRGGARVRIIMGPQDELFTPDVRQILLTSRYTISSQSNRMGYRLEGPELIRQPGADVLSDATPMGTLQVPPSGQPILLMADRQTTGGYPKIGVVITADLPVAGQLAPGDWIEFVACSRSEAVAALRRRELKLAGLA
jgi:antagonist of KipI